MSRPADPFLPPGLVRRGLLATTALLPVALLGAPAAAQAPNARPTGGQVSAGSATIGQSATTTTINQGSNRAVIDWQRFDVGRDHTVRFQQPSASSWTLNRVNTPDPSLIAGSIQANGGVAIVNQSGVVFTPGSQVNVGSLIASAAGITNENFMAGRMVFDRPANPGARVENHGNVTVADRGLATLVGPGVANSGTIRARLGRVALAGAETFTLDLAGDGLVSLDVTQSVRQAPEGAVALVTNSGTIDAAGGSVLLTADAARGVVDTMLRNTGRISADAASGTAAGQVALRGGAGGDVQVAAGTVSATGTAAGVRGGRVEVTSAGGAVTVARGARLDASGAAGGGAVQLGGGTTARVTVAGEAAARGTGATVRGGLVAAQAKDAVLVQGGGKLDASGTGGGGTVLAGTTGIGRNQTMAATTTIEAGAELRADATLQGNGGTIAINSTQRTESLGLLAARGGPEGGDGGFIEGSGLRALVLGDNILLDAPAGTAGTLLIDPEFIIIQNGGATAGQPPVSGLLAFTDDPTGDGNVGISVANINRDALNNTNVILQAGTSITVNDNLVRTTNGSVFLESNGTITINNNRSVDIQNGAFGMQAPTVTMGNNASVQASTQIVVTADTLNINQGRSLSAPTVSLRANTLNLNATATIAGTTLVEIGPRVANSADFSTTSFGNILARLGNITTPLLRLGRTTAAGDRTWASVAPDAAVAIDSITLDTAITRSGLNLELAANNSVQIQNAVNLGTGTLTLRALAAAGTVAQVQLPNPPDPDPPAPVPTITVGRLAGQAGTGGFTVDNATNVLVSLGDIASGGNVGIRSTGALSVDGAVSGGAAGVVRITAAGALGVASTGSVTAGALGGTDAVPVAGTGQVHLWGNGVSLAGAVTGGERVSLTSSSSLAAANRTGGVTQSGTGTVRAGALAASGATVGLTLAGNRILAANAGAQTGNIAIRSDRALTVPTTSFAVDFGDASGSYTLTGMQTPAGDVRLAAPGLTVNGVLVAGGDATRSVTLVTDALSFGGADLVAPGDALTPGTVTITRLTDGVIDLGGAGAIAGALEIVGAQIGAIDFASRLRIGGGLDAATLAPTGAGGSSIQVTAPVDLTASSIALLDLRATGVTQAATGAGITVARLEATVDSGGLLLNGEDNVITRFGAITAGGTSTLRVDAGIELDGAVDLGSANTLNLRTDGTVTQSAGAIVTAGTLDVRGATGAAADAISLGRDNIVGALSAASSGAIALRSARTAGVSVGAISGASDISVSAIGAVTVNGAVVSTGAGTIRIETRDPLSVAVGGSVTSGGVGAGDPDTGLVHLWGQGISLAGPVIGGNTVTMNARAGSLDGSLGATLPANVTQSGAGLVSTRRLGLRARGDVTLDLANQVESVGALVTGGITVNSARALSIATLIDFPVPAGGTATTGTGVQSVTGNIALTAPSLTIANPIIADAGNITLTANSAGGAITRTAGTIQATAANRTITLTADGIALSGADPAISANADTGTVVLQPFGATVDLVADAALDLGLIATETLSLRSGRDVLISGTPTLTDVGVLDLQAGRTVRQTAGTITIGRLQGSAAAGDFLVEQAGNQITTLGAITADTGLPGTGSVGIASTTGITVAGAIAADRAVTLVAPAVTVNETIGAGAGAATLTATAGSIDVNAEVGSSSAGVTLTANAGSIQIDAAIDAGTGIVLTGRDGVAQTAPGALTANAGAGSLSASSALGAVDLDAASNELGSVSGSAFGAFAVSSTTGLTVGPVSAGGSVTIGGAGITVSGAVTSDTGDVALTAATAGLDVNAAVEATLGGVTLTASQGTVQLDAPVTAGTTIALSGRDGVSQTVPGVLTANAGTGQLSAFASDGSVALTAAANEIGGVNGTAEGSFAIRSINDLAVGSVDTGSGATITGLSLTVTGPVQADTGNVTLTASGGNIEVNGTVTATEGQVAVTANAGAVQIDAAVTAGANISLTGRDGVAQSASGVLTADAGAGSLSASSALGAVDLDAAGNQVGAITGSADTDFAFRSLAALTVNAVTADGTVGITGAGLTVSGTVSGGAVSLEASSGDIDVNAAVTADLSTVALTANAGEIQLDAAVNAGTGITLTGRDGIAQTAPGLLTADAGAGSLAANSADGAVALIAAANAVGSVTGTAEGAFRFRGAATVTAGPITADTAEVRLIAPTLNVTGLVQSLGNATPVTLVADALTLGANTLAAGAVGQAGTLTITRITAGTLDVGGANAAGFTAVDTAGILRAARLVLGGALDAATVPTGGTVLPAVRFSGAANLTAEGVGVLELRATGATQTATGAISVGTLEATAGAGGVLLGNAVNAVGAVSGTSDGDFTLFSSSALTVGSVAADGGVTLTAAGMTVNGPVTADAGPVFLTASSGTLAVNGTVTATLGGVGLSATLGSLQIDDAVTAGTNITLSGRLGVAQGAGGVLTANGGTGSLTANSTFGAVDLDAASNEVGSVGGSSGGAFEVSSLNGLTVGSVSAGGAVAITGPDVTVGGPVTASAGDITLVASKGVIEVDGAVTASAGGIAMTASAGTVQIDAAVTANGAVTLTGRDGIGVNATVRALSGDAAMTASEGTIQLDAAVSASGIITLTGRDGVAQTAPGVLTAGAGAGALAASSAEGSVALTASNVVGSVSGSADDDFAFRSTSGLVVGSVSVGGAVDITGPSLTVTGPVTATAGDLALTATSTGIVVNGVVTASAGAVDLTAQGGNVTVNAATTATAGAMTVSATLGTIQVNAPLTAETSLSLSARNAVRQGAAGVLTVDGGAGSVVANATLGEVALATAGNVVGAVSGTSGTTFDVASTVGLGVGSVGAGGAVTIAGPGITVTGPVTAGSGNVALSASTTDVTVGGAVTATLGQVVLTASQGAVQVDAAVTAGSSISLTGRDGVAQTAPGVLVANAGAGALTANASQGAVALALAENRVGSVAGAADDDFALRSVTGLVVGSVAAGGGVTISGPALTVTGPVTATAGDITLTATGTDLVVNGTVTATAGEIRLDAGSGDVDINAAVTATAGPVTLVAGQGSIQVDAAVTAGGDIELNSLDGVAQGAGGVLSADAGAGAVVAVASSGAVSLLADNIAGAIAGLAGAGDFDFRSVAGLEIGSVTASGAVRITGPGLAVTGPVRADTGAVVLTAASADIDVNGAVTASAGPVTLTADAGAIQLDAAVSAGTSLTLAGRDGIAQTAPGVLEANAGAGALVASSGAGSVELHVADNRVGSVAGSAGIDFELLSVTGLTVGSVNAGRSVTITGPGITLVGPLNAGTGDATLTASSGDVLAGNANATAAGTLRLSAAANGRMVRLTGGSYSAEYIVLAAGPGAGGTGTVNFSGTSFQVGTAFLAAGGGGVGAATDTLSTITPQDAGAFPLIFLETRRSATALRALDTAVFAPVTRDLPTRDAGEQVWQIFSLRRPQPPGVRVVGVADGSGAATNNPAGPVVLNMEAGTSPVFLLIDGGIASGALNAGRLGIHGRAGSDRVDGDLVGSITGTLSAIGGSAAAQFGRVATVDPRDQSLYRVNNCVIDTINCVAPSVAQPVILPVSNRVDIRSDNARLDPDVLLPNIAEEDY